MPPPESRPAPAVPPPALGPLPLYDYQESILDQTKGLLQQNRSLLITAPTGAGKTVVLSEMTARALQRQARVAVLVHRQELVRQSEAALLRQTGQPPGVVWKNRAEWDQPCLILAQDTIHGRPMPDLKLDLLIIDEAHHAIAPSWLETIHRLQPRYLLGFSATPFRQDKEPLSPNPFGQVIRPVTPQQLIDRGLICPARIESPLLQDKAGNIQPINQAANLSDLYIRSVDYAVSRGRHKIILYVSANSEEPPSRIMARTAAALTRQGIPSEAIGQNLTENQRQDAAIRFRANPGATVLVNYMTLTEGTDLPCTDCVIIGRQTKSESTIIQMIGRGLRRHPGKEDCLVLDYTGRLDMSDIVHYWRIDADQKVKADKEAEKRERLSPPELLRLAAAFPEALGSLGSDQSRYPWFKPFPQKPLMALPLAPQESGADRYVTVEPTANGRWRVTQITLNRSGPAPLTRRQTAAESRDAAAQVIRKALGSSAPHVERKAPWRQQPASPAQLQAWLKLHPEHTAAPQGLLAGEVSDAIALRRFVARVPPRLL